MYKQTLCRAALLAISLSCWSAPTRAAEPLSYSFLPLNVGTTRVSFASATNNGYSVGFGRSDSSSTANRAFAWDMVDNSPINLVSSTTSQANDTQSNIAVGVHGNKATTWNLQNGARTELNNIGLFGSNAYAIDSGFAVGSGAMFDGTSFDGNAYMWGVSNNTRQVLSKSGFLSATALDIKGNVIVGSAHEQRGQGSAEVATEWNRATGEVRRLDQTGLRESRAVAYRSGVAVGNGYDNALDGFYATAWDTATNTRLALDNSSFSSSFATDVSTSLVLGWSSRPDIGDNQSRATAWRQNGSERFDLQSLFMPTQSRNSIISAVGDNGTLVGNYSIDASFTPRAFALVPFRAMDGDTLLTGQTAKVSGSLTQESGTTILNGTYSFVGGAGNNIYTLTETAILGGSGTLTGNLLQTGGILAPGNSPGTFTVDGDYTLSGGTLSIEIAGLAAGSFDRVLVSGMATLSAGAVSVSLSGFSPVAGDSWDIVEAEGGLSLSTVSVPTGYTLTSTGNAARLTFIGATVVPEANAGLLFLLTLPVGAFVLRRRK